MSVHLVLMQLIELAMAKVTGARQYPVHSYASLL